MAESFMFSTDKFVWIDKTGSDVQDQSTKYGYAVRGQTPIVCQFENCFLTLFEAVSTKYDGSVMDNLCAPCSRGFRPFPSGRNTGTIPSSIHPD